MKTEIRIDPCKKYQTFEGFGASGAWWAQIVGGWEHPDPESGKPVRDRISELLYNPEVGIGMQIYRYNLGGGSVQSGKGRFDQPARRAESFDTDSSGYDWSRDKNAVYMMKSAAENGAREIILFVNSPPERLTKNGKAHLDKAWHENLAKENYLPFAKYCLDVTEHFVKEGLPIKYLSPVNEPLWVWTGGQEGCHYRPASVRKVLRVFAEELEKRTALKGIRLSGAENGDIRWFNKSYTRQLLKDPIVKRNLDSVDFHSYCVPAVKLPFINNRIAYVKRFRRWMDRHYPAMPLKMSEWTHMQGGRDKGMDSALEMAKIMFEDISVLNVTSWQHWIAVSEVDYCDGLIYINLEDKTFEMTKRFYATGNFSKFVAPGSQRVAVFADDSELQPLAFVSGSQTVLILINQSENKKTISLKNCGAASAKLFVTNSELDLAEFSLDTDSDILISPKSVNTIVY